MKIIVGFIFLMLSIVGNSQIGSPYKDVQKLFGADNVNATTINTSFTEIKQLSKTEIIKFKYNAENVVDLIEVESKQPISSERFHELSTLLNPRFKITSAGNHDNLKLYFDSKHQLLNIKSYKGVILNKVIFISDTEMISELIPDIENWH
ncbi:hypothetical protein [Lacinutrix chionoecetis]